MNTEQGVSNDEVKLFSMKTSMFIIPCSLFDIQKFIFW